jgi:hypothetical protein
VDPGALERSITGLIAASAEEKRRLGVAARAWYEQNDAAFRARLRELWSGLMAE